ncbi:glycosyltransferase family 20-domain-containing protein [Dichotomocladium elegans]|nr:glycosyltransferase family 20-domain-containing protein [Dichotomocladium elegans]
MLNPSPSFPVQLASVLQIPPATRIINVTHQIPYNIHRKRPLPLSPPQSPTSSKSSPISKHTTSRHHQHLVKFQSDDWLLVERRGHAALYSGLASLHDHYPDSIHIGWTGPIDQELHPQDELSLIELLEPQHIVPVFVDNEARMGHYAGYCKEVLWPLFHYVMRTTATDGRAERRHWEDYKAVNQLFADTIVQQYQPGNIIWIHDYHLLLVPEMVRKVIPDAVIGIFFHATFPSSEILRCLTTRKEILKGVLGANLVGFQTYAYARHFISSSTRILGCESTLTGINLNGHLVSVGAFPIGIDTDRVLSFHAQPNVQPKIDSIIKMHRNKIILVGRDKLDPTKGIIQKLRGFRKFLELYPEYRDRVVLLQVTTPTLLHKDHSLDTKITELVSQINSEYGSLAFQPLHHYYQDIDRDEYYALLSVAHAALITSARDGMNTTSLEYILCQQSTHHGPLILSEFTGMASTLSNGAILVNPWDEVGVANAILKALIMSPEEKDARHERLYRHVTEHTAAFWAHSFVTQLSNTSRPPQPTEIVVQEMTTAYAQANQRLFLLDYDRKPPPPDPSSTRMWKLRNSPFLSLQGTLAPITRVPEEAKPGKDMLSTLERLCKDPHNHVWVVSGRDQASLDSWLGHIPGLGLSAEHGCYFRYPESKRWYESAAMDDGKNSAIDWRDQVTQIFEYYTERTQGSFIEHKRASITWHYRLADAQYGEFQAKECQNHLENNIVPKLPVDVLINQKTIEVRPVNINKGVVAKRILAELNTVDLVICAGDDRTDEDMFGVLMTPDDLPQSPTSGALVRRRSISVTLPLTGHPTTFCIAVGHHDKQTMANRRVRTTDDLLALLKCFASLNKQ